MTFEPHMHASGKRMCVEAILPSGIRQTLNCAGYNHNWVKVYKYEDDVAPLLPANTILHIIGWYDKLEEEPAQRRAAELEGLRQPVHRRHDDQHRQVHRPDGTRVQGRGRGQAGETAARTGRRTERRI